MKEFTTQIEHIKAKLKKAKEVDHTLKAFGASSHKYHIGPPVSTEQIEEFEHKFSVTLPESYKAFLLYFGNGGHLKNSSAAGPFYGVYPLGKNCCELVYRGHEEVLKNNCILSPNMTAEEWEQLRDVLEDDALPEEQYIKDLNRIYGGLLPIGSQGCTYLHAIVLNGKHKGKVVNLNQENQQPRFAFEDNFLDWYERWLDEVISGDLLVDSPTWFGYTMGGSQEFLIETFKTSENSITKINALWGLLKKRALSNDTLEVLYQSQENADKEYEYILQLLVKYKYKNWKRLLVEYASVNLLSVFKFLYWYDKDNCLDWKDFITVRGSKITNSALFDYYLYLLKECRIDYGPYIKNFVKSEDKRIRISTIGALSKLENKGEYLDEFVSGLQDESDEVVRHTLYALVGITSERLLPYFKNILERFPDDKYYIFPKLKKCLEHFNVDVQWLKAQEFKA